MGRHFAAALGTEAAGGLVPGAAAPGASAGVTSERSLYWGRLYGLTTRMLRHPTSSHT